MARCWVEVDLQRLDRNIQSLRDVLRPQTDIIFVVKANAYGHGAQAVAQRAAARGVRWFAVAYAEEALELRAVLPDVNILVIGVVQPDEVSALLEHRIIPIVADFEHGCALAAEAEKLGATLPVHVKIDTGMGRIGLPWQQAPELIIRLDAKEGLDIQGLCSHFAMVEKSEPQAAKMQADRFLAAVDNIQTHLGRQLFKHLSSSRAILYHAEWDLDGIRPGIVLYGYGTGDESMRAHTRPILQWKTRVIQVKSVPENFAVGYYSIYVTSRPTDIAVIACGYADGYLRALHKGGQVLIHGRRCPVVGAVSMNWIAVDLGPGSGVQRGDEAVLIGAQQKERVWANELAAICRTIPYEILVGIDAKIERRYVG
ncbi:MAG: alanine racemase [Spartobacteria bacterium]|nr:alanine racemase [Spartobacteria bacterium]